MSVKFGDSISTGSRDIEQRSSVCGIFDRFLNFDNCQPEAASYVISGMAVEDVGMDVCAHFGDSRLKTSDAAFLDVFRTSITSDHIQCGRRPYRLEVSCKTW